MELSINASALPIADKKEEIVSTILAHQVTIVVAKTGAGKSTQVPKYLLQAGKKVLITQPRRLATRTVAERVAEECGEILGGKVGFRTAYERKECRHTRCLFVTDGLALLRELAGKRKEETILIIDEIHEWNLNEEVLCAVVRKTLKDHPKTKVVLMSATLEAEKLSAYFGGAPIVNVSGVEHEVRDFDPKGDDMVVTAEKLLRAKRETLVFLPGKAEIEKFCRDLEATGVDAEILPLHAEVSYDDQQRCFRRYGRPRCIVATNIAQTSITIEGIDAVLDSGLENRQEVVDGVEGLYTMPISLADKNQRRGRTGRTCKGIYADFCPVSESERPEFSQAAISRSLLDQIYLRLLMQGIDMEALEFFHQPDKKEIHNAKESLWALGCIDKEGKVTELGEKVSQLPVSVRNACMLVEAQKLGVLADVLTIISVLEVKGILEKGGRWRSLCKEERESDLLAQLAVYKGANKQNAEWLEDNGVNIKSLHRAREIRAHILECLRLKTPTSTGKREDIIRAICAGLVEHVFRNDGEGFVNCKGPRRKIPRGSVVSGSEWVVGVPFDRGDEFSAANLLTMVTVVKPALFMEAAPHLVRREEHADAYFDEERCRVMSFQRTLFMSHVMDEKVRPVRPSEEDPASLAVCAEVLRPHFVALVRRQVAVKRYEAMLVSRLNRRKGETLRSFRKL